MSLRDLHLWIWNLTKGQRLKTLKKAILAEREACAAIAAKQHQETVNCLARNSESVGVSSTTFVEGRKTAYFSGAIFASYQIEKRIRERE